MIELLRALHLDLNLNYKMGEGRKVLRLSVKKLMLVQILVSENFSAPPCVYSDDLNVVVIIKFDPHNFISKMEMA